MIYGDSWTVRGTSIENIGNNVSLVFNDMDFGQQCADRIEICWRSAIDKNSIQFVFKTDEGIEVKEMIRVTRSEDYTTRVFPLGKQVTGNTTMRNNFV